jgi:ADP-ribosylglycohydrolase
MLLEMAIGDAFGAAFEFVTPQAQKEAGLINDGRTFQNNPQIPIGGGRYTDDTQMALAMAEQMVHGVPLTRELFFEKVFNTFHRDPREGYGTKTGNILRISKDPDDFQFRMSGEEVSSRSGAAMRSGPFGLYSSTTEVIELSTRQASFTHDTEEGREGAKAVALMTHYFAYDLGPKARLGAFLEDLTDVYAWNSPWESWVSYYAHPVVSAAITAVTNSRSMTEVFKNSVAFGGDVDTVAAIASFAASLSPEIENDIDLNLYDMLEDGPFGSRYLTTIDEQLAEFARTQGAKVFTRIRAS